MLIKDVAVFSDKKSDIVNGWLKPCIGNCRTVDSSSFIRQYCKLLTYLGFDSMERSMMDNYYKIANEEGFLERVKKVNDLTNKIPAYRAEKFKAAIINYKPFSKSVIYKSCDVIFQNFWEDENQYKLDIVFEENGNVFIQFWNEAIQNENGKKAVANKIKQISYQNELIEDGEWFRKKFELREYQNMESIDKAVTDFTKNLMKALN
ncbi:hypothetical protein ES705_46391 [subsurface metagenome]